jgi:hypothetical protein
MVSLGIRVKAKEIFFAVINVIDGEIHLKTIERVIVPQALEMPDRLSYIRTTFETIISEYGICNAGIRISENVQSVKNSTIERMYLEGVLQELLSNCTVEKYFAGRKNTIARLLKLEQKELSNFIDNDDQFFTFTEWTTYKSEVREAILSAVASNELEGSL